MDAEGTKDGKRTSCHPTRIPRATITAYRGLSIGARISCSRSSQRARDVLHANPPTSHTLSPSGPPTYAGWRERVQRVCSAQTTRSRVPRLRDLAMSCRGRLFLPDGRRRPPPNAIHRSAQSTAHSMARCVPAAAQGSASLFQHRHPRPPS
jgi:hypothetical protein